MIVGIFKSSQKITVLLFFLLAFLLLLPTFWIEESYDSLPYFFKSVTDIKWVNYILVVLLVSFQAAYLNYVANKYKVLKNNTHLVGLLFVVLNAAMPSLMVFSPVLLVNVFLLVILHQLLNLYNLNKAYELSFNIGLIVGFAVLVYFPVIVFFPLVWIVLVYTKAPKWREFVISFLGLMLPFVYVLLYYYFTNNVSSSFSNFAIEKRLFLKGVDMSKISTQLFFVVLLFMSLFSALNMIRFFSKSVVKVKKTLMIVILMGLFALLTLVLNSSDYSAAYLLLTIPLSVFLGNYFSEIKKTWVSEFFFTILLGMIVVGYFL